MFQLGGMLGQQNLSPTVQHAKTRHILCALTAPKERCCWLRPCIRGVQLSSKCSGRQQSPLLCRRRWRPFRKGQPCRFVCLTSATRLACKGRWHFWWQTGADTLSTDLYRWVTHSFVLHCRKYRISRCMLGWPWGHSLYSKGQVTFSKTSLPREGRRSRWSSACARQRGCESGCTSTLHPPSQHQGPLSPAGPLRQQSRGARTQADPRTHPGD